MQKRDRRAGTAGFITIPPVGWGTEDVDSRMRGNDTRGVVDGVAGFMGAPPLAVGYASDQEPTTPRDTDTIEMFSDASGVFEDYSHSYFGSVSVTENAETEDYSYLNAASCPDCSGGMVRLGSCFSCPSCGFESCSV